MLHFTKDIGHMPLWLYLRRILSRTNQSSIFCSGEPCNLALFDTAGQETYDRLRPISYPDTDVFLVCFSVMLHTSFENVKAKWVPEISHCCPKTPFLLVGTQADRRGEQGG